MLTVNTEGELAYSEAPTYQEFVLTTIRDEPLPITATDVSLDEPCFEGFAFVKDAADDVMYHELLADLDMAMAA